MIKKHLFAVALLSASCVHAQESRVETQAIRCAALSFIFTSVAPDSASFARKMSDAAAFYGDVFSAGRMVRTGFIVTNGEVAARRELALQEFRGSWKWASAAVVREAALCSAWSGEFVPRVVAGPNIESADDMLRIVGEPPAQPPPEQVELWRSVVPRAFDLWAALEYATSASARKKIEDSLKRP